MRRLLAFGVAGAIGFLVDAAVLALLLRLSPLGPFTSRLFSIAAAMAATWTVNRSVTFGPSGRHLIAEGMRYSGVGIATAIANYIIYSGALLLFPSLPPLAALVVASGLAMGLSYFGYSQFVFDR
jgi:putative flippase GtrA